VHQSGGK